MIPSSAKPEAQAAPLTPSQSKARKLIEQLTENAKGEEATAEGNIAQEFLQGIWHGNAVSQPPRRTKRREGQDRIADNAESDSP